MPPAGRPVGSVHAPTPFVVVGIGLNVSQQRDELPVPTATSLTLEGAECTDRNTIVRALLRRFAVQVDRFQSASGSHAELLESYDQRCDTIGRRVRVSLPGGEERVGTATGIDGQGRLTVSSKTGVLTVTAGDVVHLRSVGR